METWSILFLLDQMQKTSNQEMYLEQVFQQHVCAMAQEINKGKISQILILEDTRYQYTLLKMKSKSKKKSHIFELPSIASHLGKSNVIRFYVKSKIYNFCGRIESILKYINTQKPL